MKRLVLTKTKTADEDLQSVQDNVAAAFRNLGQVSPIVDGRLVTASFKTTASGPCVASVAHGLGRAFQGYIVAGYEAQGVVLAGMPWVSARTAPDRVLELSARIVDLSTLSVPSAADITLWVF